MTLHLYKEFVDRKPAVVMSHFSFKILILVVVLGMGLVSCSSPADYCREKSPEDPYVDGAEEAEEIYSACKQAAQQNPDDHELAYLAATSALETERTEEALLGFENAVKLGSCKAFYFLGDHAWHFEKDLKSAETFYKNGAECGDERAAWEIYSPGVFENSAAPELVEALYNSDMKTLNRVRFVNASYVYGFYKELGEQYLGINFNPCWKATHFRGGEVLNDLMAAEKGDASNFLESSVYEYIIPKAYQVIYPGQGEDALKQRREAFHEAGKADLLRLVESSKCDSLVTHKLVKGVEQFAKTKKTLYENVKEIAPEIKSVYDISSYLQNNGKPSN